MNSSFTNSDYKESFDIGFTIKAPITINAFINPPTAARRV